MLLVMRHQEGDLMTNCLSTVGVRHSRRIAKRLSKLERVKVHTLLPCYNGKHIRPMQTATIVCSELGVSLSILNESDMFPRNGGDDTHVIIWHHSGIPSILRKYFPKAGFVWTKDDYSGCLIIHDNYWTYDFDFFSDPSVKQRFINRIKAWWTNYINIYI